MSLKFLVYGTRGWIGNKVYQHLKENNHDVVSGNVRVNDVNALEQEILEVKPTHVISLIGRTHGTYEVSYYPYFTETEGETYNYVKNIYTNEYGTETRTKYKTIAFNTFGGTFNKTDGSFSGSETLEGTTYSGCWIKIKTPIEISINGFSFSQATIDLLDDTVTNSCLITKYKLFAKTQYGSLVEIYDGESNPNTDINIIKNITFTETTNKYNEFYFVINGVNPSDNDTTDDCYLALSRFYLNTSVTQQTRKTAKLWEEDAYHLNEMQIWHKDGTNIVQGKQAYFYSGGKIENAIEENIRTSKIADGIIQDHLNNFTINSAFYVDLGQNYNYYDLVSCVINVSDTSMNQTYNLNGFGGTKMHLLNQDLNIRTEELHASTPKFSTQTVHTSNDKYDFEQYNLNNVETKLTSISGLVGLYKPENITFDANGEVTAWNSSVDTNHITSWNDTDVSDVILVDETESINRYNYNGTTQSSYLNPSSSNFKYISKLAGKGFNLPQTLYSDEWSIVSLERLPLYDNNNTATIYIQYNSGSDVWD